MELIISAAFCYGVFVTIHEKALPENDAPLSVNCRLHSPDGRALSMSMARGLPVTT